LPLPERIEVKLSSEAAGSISFTPVVRRQMSPPELLEAILGVTGKDVARVGEVLRHGSLVSGASRFRWPPLEASAEEIATGLAAFPDSLPDRPFDPARCVRARLSGGRAAIDLNREAAGARRWLRRRSFWEVLLDAAAGLPLAYQHYSYAGRADLYGAELTPQARRSIREQAGLLRYSALEGQVREYGWDRLELWVER